MTTVRDYTALLSGSSINGTIGRPTFVTYSFPQSAPAYLSAFYNAAQLASFEPLNAAAQALARSTIEEWAAVSGLTAFEAAPGQGDVQFMAFDLLRFGDGSSKAFAYEPAVYQSVAWDLIASDIFVDWSVARAATDRYLFLHEIGHALGLKHPFERTPLLAPDLDNVRMTVMSYNRPEAFNGSLGPMDREAIRFLYGAFQDDGRQASTWSWDAATRTLHQSGDAAANTLYGTGAPDVVNGLDGNDTIFGRAGDDRLFGGPGADVIDGELGNDYIDGGDGDDVLSGGELVDTVALAKLIATHGVSTGFVVTPGLQLEGTRYGIGDDDTLIGGMGDDVLIGGWGRNVIDGGLGEDVLLLLRPIEDYGFIGFDGRVIVFAREERHDTTGVERAVAVGGQRMLDAASVTSFDPIRYVASNADLIGPIGANASAAVDHYVTAGFFHGRATARFDALNYLANNRDLILAFGPDTPRATRHFVELGFVEGRTASFDPLRYAASYADLAGAFGLNGDAATRHWVTNGAYEGRDPLRFDPTGYLVVNVDVLRAFGPDTAAAARHFLEHGRSEGRTDRGFDALRYAAGYSDLQIAFGIDASALTQHFLWNGMWENRNPLLFDGLRYIASNGDLILAFGYDASAGVLHWIVNGRAEGRDEDSFNPLAYARANEDVAAAFGQDPAQLTRHWIDFGFREGRSSGGAGDEFAPLMQII